MAIKTRVIHDGEVKAPGKVADEVLNTLEHWCRWGSSEAREAIGGVHKSRAGIWHDMGEFSNICTEFSKVALLQVMDFIRGSRKGLC